MKKYVLTVSLVLLLLVSCATKKAETEVIPETVETTVIEQLPPTVSEVSEVSEDVVPPVEESFVPQQETSVETVVPETEVAVSEEVTPSTATVEAASEEAPVTDWGYVFTSPSSPSETEEAAQPVKSEEVKSTSSKPSAVEASKAPVIEEENEPQNTSFITKFAYFFAHETLFSLGLLVCLGGLIYFIIALVKSSGMIEKKKPAVREAEPSQPSQTSQTDQTDQTKEDVEPQDSSSGFNSEDENDEFLRALLGEDKK